MSVVDFRWSSGGPRWLELLRGVRIWPCDFWSARMRRPGVSRIVVVQQALVRQLVGNTVKGAWVQGQACTLAKVL